MSGSAFTLKSSSSSLYMNISCITCNDVCFQLLARLGPRPSLRGTGAAELLGFEPSPGDILEIYGGEGVGKSELLLNLVTSVLLPGTRGQHQDDGQGNQTQVIWVDCDLKFSVLRLAVLLEQWIVSEQSEKNNDSAGCGKDGGYTSGKRSANSESTSCVSQESLASAVEFKDQYPQGHSHSTLNCTLKTSMQVVAVSQSNNEHEQKFKTPHSALKRKSEDMERADPSKCTGNKESAKTRNKFPDLVSTTVHVTPSKHTEGMSVCPESHRKELSTEEVEKKVLGCLERVQVVRCMSSQQLICTLHSLKSVISANRNIALLVLDSVSSFFWSNKCSDFNNAFLDKSMSHISSVLKKIAEVYGVFVVATKQALTKPRPKENFDSMVSSSTRLNSSSYEAGHVEFLGAAWSGIVTRRLTCSKSVLHQAGAKTTKYTLTGPAVSKHFTISESGVHVDQ